MSCPNNIRIGTKFWICIIFFVIATANYIIKETRQLDLALRYFQQAQTSSPPPGHDDTQEDHDRTQFSVRGIDHRQPLSHPHAGANFPNGTKGMILDPTSMKDMTLDTTLSSREFNICFPHQCQPSDVLSEITINVLKKLRNHIVHNTTMPWNITTYPDDDTYHSNNDTVNNNTQYNETSSNRHHRSPRILCAVYTYSEGHDRIKAILETWGRKCDGFLAASDKTDLTIGAINLLHKGEEKYGNMWQKIRSIYGYIYDNYLNDFDYFHFCGDDTFVMVDNLRSFVSGEQVGEKLYNGHMDVWSMLFHDVNQASQKKYFSVLSKKEETEKLPDLNQ